ncbi:MAG TPA: HAMP domain-containing sensor histidine kinase [Mucilaginibacter sp.]|nr:HAMP domain-containing sensor histidine kinase [Mucilaginibacter sp.]
MKKVIIALSATVLIATAAITLTHYYSVRTLSACRAYTNFESQYSKSEKDAARHLLNYIYSHEETDYLLFKNDLSIAKGDSIARTALTNGSDRRIARIGFLMGGSHPDDLSGMIWFFKRFRNADFVEKAIQYWKNSDQLAARLNIAGISAHQAISAGKPLQKDAAVLEINTISDEFTVNQQNFSALLGSTSREAGHKVFVADLVISILILTCVTSLSGLMLKKMHASKKVIIEQNQTLADLNAHINKFVFSVTHDLRSPLTSLSGLVSVLEREKDIKKVPEYTEMMRESIQLQDDYIKEVLKDIRENRVYETERCNLNEIVRDVMTQNSFFASGGKIKFLSELEVWEIKCNGADLKTVFNNLISNAIKYADFTKPEQWIKIKSYRKGNNCCIEVEDNGVGIQPEQHKQIFRKYFKSGFAAKSMGLGLYFVKQAIEQMNGTISVNSLPGGGTSFIVSLPL